MIPLSSKLNDLRRLPRCGINRPTLSVCRSCERYEQGPDSSKIGGISHWCVSKYFDKIKKRSVTCYANIELLQSCPKKVVKKQYR